MEARDKARTFLMVSPPRVNLACKEIDPAESNGRGQTWAY